MRKSVNLVDSIGGGAYLPSTYPYMLVGQYKYILYPNKIYDTVDIPIAPAPAQTEIQFFQRQEGANGVTLFTTNMKSAGKMSLAEGFLISQIGVFLLFEDDEPFSEAALLPLIYEIQNGILSFEIEQKPFYQTPIHNMIALCAPISANTQSLLAPADRRLLYDIVLKPEVHFKVVLKFPNGIQVSSEAAELARKIQIILDGYSMQPAEQALA